MFMKSCSLAGQTFLGRRSGHGANERYVVVHPPRLSLDKQKVRYTAEEGVELSSAKAARIHKPWASLASRVLPPGAQFSYTQEIDNLSGCTRDLLLPHAYSTTEHLHTAHLTRNFHSQFFLSKTRPAIDSPRVAHDERLPPANRIPTLSAHHKHTSHLRLTPTTNALYIS